MSKMIRSLHTSVRISVLLFHFIQLIVNHGPTVFFILFCFLFNSVEENLFLVSFIVFVTVVLLLSLIFSYCLLRLDYPQAGKKDKMKKGGHTI